MKADILGVRKVIYTEILFGLLYALCGKNDSLFLFIDDIIARKCRRCSLFIVKFLDYMRSKSRGKSVRLFVHLGGRVALARNDKRSSRLVYEYRVNLVHDGKRVASAERRRALLHDHIVAQIVKSELVVCSVGNVRVVCGFSLLLVSCREL